MEGSFIGEKFDAWGRSSTEGLKIHSFQQDVGLVPVIIYLTPGYEVTPNISVYAESPVNHFKILNVT